ncbi:hypothetical protein U1Q18_028735 [Sarracenia purpurea var. burkii]
MSDPGNALPNGDAALNPEDQEVLSNALKRNLKEITDDYFNVLDLSRKSQHNELEAMFFKERTALEAKYQRLYQPLYTKRYDIINGIAEVEVNKTLTGQEGNEAEGDKGVPNFWLIAMKTNETLAAVISEEDEGALKYLKDIKWLMIYNPKGFKLEFYFDANPYFKNSVLTKTYHVIEEGEPLLDRAIG